MVLVWIRLTCSRTLALPSTVMPRSRRTFGSTAVWKILWLGVVEISREEGEEEALEGDVLPVERFLRCEAKLRVGVRGEEAEGVGKVRRTRD